MRKTLLLLLAAGAAVADPPVLVHGHRGARAMRPENTIPAFEYAIAQGVDVLEMDLAVTRDNVLVLSHDPVLSAEKCRGPEGTRVIHELTLEQVRRFDCGAAPIKGFPKQQPVPRTRIPTFDEVLALAPRGNFGFNVETKSFPKSPEYAPPPEEFARLVAAAIRRHKLEARMIVQSFDFRTLAAMKKIMPEVKLSALWNSGDRSFVEIAREAAGAQIVSPEHRLATPERVKEAHAAGIQVVPWTADTPADWDRLIAAGVDAIITDDPAALIAHLKARGLRKSEPSGASPRPAAAS
jgi:glycerophosphoryl diester phosphodiesterase